MKLQEYVSLTIPRPLVERAVEALALIGISSGPLGDLRDQLTRSLNRDRKREAIARIQRTLHRELGNGELLDEIATAVEQAILEAGRYRT